MTYETFKSGFSHTEKEILHEILISNRDSIRVKKESTALENLTRIFDAALAIANQKGFKAMSMRDLSAASGLSMGALYCYFKSKDDLLEMMLGHGRSIVSKTLERNIAMRSGPVERLDAGIRTHLYLSEIMRPWFYFSYMESRHIPDFHKESNIMGELYTEGLFLEILDQGVKCGVFKPRDVGLTAAAIKAMLQDWYLKRRKYRLREIRIDDYGDFILDFTLTYMGAMAPKGV